MIRAAVALVLVATLAAGALAGTPRFHCLTDGSKPTGRNFFIFNKSKKKERAAVAMTESGDVSQGYPVGTLLQLFPFEAMLKRKPGFNPDGDDWEFFQLAVEPRKNGKYRTRIVARGTSDVANGAGSCQGCHVRFARDHDLVCEFVIGAAGLGLTDAQIAVAQAADPRCKK